MLANPTALYKDGLSLFLKNAKTAFGDDAPSSLPSAPAAPSAPLVPQPSAPPAKASSGSPLRTAWAVASTVSSAVSAYHGYKRNDSIGWALWWGLMGSMFPVITPTIALAEGFAKPIKK